MNNGTHIQRMTEGSPLRLLIGFTVPLLLGALFQQLYYTVDTMVVGRLLGAQALAGVGSTGAVSYLVIGFCMGICFGFTIPIAQKFGAGDNEGLRRTIGNIIWTGALLAFLITCAVTLLRRQILIWMHTPEDAFAYADAYINIVFLGIPAAFLYNILSGIIRSLGDSRTPLYFLIFSSLTNIALDLILILYAQMGVAGAALATVISQLVSGLLCLLLMIRRFPVLRLKKDDLKLRRAESTELLRMGIPMGLQCSVTALGCTILQTAINGLGASAVAATTLATRVKLLFSCPIGTMGNAIATFVGQNAGAGRLDRIREGARCGFKIGTVYSVISLVLIYLYGTQMMMPFLRPEDTAVPEILTMGRQYLVMCVLFFIPLVCVNVLRFTIQGMGFSGLAMFAGVMELAGRGGIGLLLVGRFGFTAVCLAEPAAWVLADLFLIPLYFICLKKLQNRWQANPVRTGMQ